MAYSNINKPNEYFNSVLYTGNGGTNNITGVEFQPDLVWIKNRNSTNEHNLTDIVRGATKYLHSNLTQSETTAANSLTSFDSDGFSLGNNANFNTNTNTYVAWNWLADNTSGSSNTDGSITSTVSANTTSGFSIVSYTGNGSAGATIGHGLGVKPAMMIIKNRISGAESWQVYHQAYGTGTQYFLLNSTDAVLTFSTVFNNTAPTSSVFSVGTAGGTNGSSQGMIAYCFAEKKGFSKFGSYTGNGSTDGTFIYTGFKPAFFITKRTDSAASWKLLDNKRDAYNDGTGANLNVNDNDAEDDNSAYAVDFLSNGFKIRNANANFNTSGGTYIYMAFAENPLVAGNYVPTTAR